MSPVTLSAMVHVSCILASRVISGKQAVSDWVNLGRRVIGSAAGCVRGTQHSSQSNYSTYLHIPVHIIIVHRHPNFVEQDDRIDKCSCSDNNDNNSYKYNGSSYPTDFTRPQLILVPTRPLITLSPPRSSGQYRYLQ